MEEVVVGMCFWHQNSDVARVILESHPPISLKSASRDDKLLFQFTFNRLAGIQEGENVDKSVFKRASKKGLWVAQSSSMEKWAYVYVTGNKLTGTEIKHLNANSRQIC